MWHRKSTVYLSCLSFCGFLGSVAWRSLAQCTELDLLSCTSLLTKKLLLLHAHILCSSKTHTTQCSASVCVYLRLSLTHIIHMGEREGGREGDRERKREREKENVWLYPTPVSQCSAFMVFLPLLTVFPWEHPVSSCLSSSRHQLLYDVISVISVSLNALTLWLLQSV